MLTWVIKPLHILTESLRDEESPHRFALGISLGMLAGLVPKDNLTATLIATLILSLRLNLSAAAGSALVCMWVGGLIDPLAHWLGNTILTSGPLAPVLARLFDLPLVPWTNLNNTVVLGNLVIGLVLAYPTWWLSKRAIATYRPWLIERLEKFGLLRAIAAADVASGWRVS